ncbi:MAG: class I SAM-dependent methyltransferase [Rhodospirillaceae bacterium]|nr:class I SAM-dependent methyltransferase [Rhodospirillaceae bacterium]
MSPGRLLRALLERTLEEGLPPPVALMRLLLAAAAPGEVERALAAAAPTTARRARQVETLRALLDANPQAWHVVKAVQARLPAPLSRSGGTAAVRRWAAAFDDLAGVSPDAAAALYALGNPALLRAATAEVAGRMRRWGLLGRDRRLAEIGCGTGRFEEALAGEAAAILGLDVSAAMLAVARRRCASLANVAFVLTSGADLAPLPDDSIDLLFAVDSFPYIVDAGPALVARHFAEAGRVVRHGGELLIFNFSYRNDPVADREEVLGRGEAAGFAALRLGSRDLERWDGITFRLRRR